jgi:hypothetical protein
MYVYIYNRRGPKHNVAIILIYESSHSIPDWFADIITINVYPIARKKVNSGIYSSSAGNLGTAPLYFLKNAERIRLEYAFLLLTFLELYDNGTKPCITNSM